jgi:prepilin-type N-terminal cleavage/methylation domain-containing protein
MKKKGFTLVELLVVIAIIALLMGILMPALARVRQIAFRMVCGTNLSGIGKAMLSTATTTMMNCRVPAAETVCGPA